MCTAKKIPHEANCKRLGAKSQTVQCTVRIYIARFLIYEDTRKSFSTVRSDQLNQGKNLDRTTNGEI